MNRNLIILLFLLTPLCLWSQEDICIGKQYTLDSKVLHEKRSYWVHLPDNYDKNSKETYPVIYLLDGDSFFKAMVGMTHVLCSGRGKRMPEHIIVGVLNTDRTRDLTPTASAAGRDGKISPGAAVEGGGSKNFSKFLTGELRHAVDSAFRTNGHNVLIGHSYGGLFTMYTFLNHPELFDTYIAIDPSLWWDQAKLAKSAGSLIAGKDFTGKNLFVGTATKKRTDRVITHFYDADHLLSTTLPQVKGLHYFLKDFPDDTHGTVAIPGFYYGLMQLFK